MDLVINTPKGAVPVEIKSGATIASDFFKGLNHWDRMAGGSMQGILVYGGDRNFRRNNVSVRSWRQWP